MYVLKIYEGDYMILKNLKQFKKLTIYTLVITIFFSLNIRISHADETLKTKSDSKVIYLTFDDGPAGKITSDVLDILKENQVPATFFLIGCQINGQENLVKRIYDEGHSIGLHSMTHKRNSLYCSNEQFLKEMMDTQQLISTILPIKSNILRFPFGCNNNTYKISQTMVDMLHRNNLKIYDWNTDSGDGANPNSDPSVLLKNSKSNKDRVILLMHCGYLNGNSVKALSSIIKYYKDNGYEFKGINEDTPEEFHFIKHK